jgi:hypothetical protein
MRGTRLSAAAMILAACTGAACDGSAGDPPATSGTTATESAAQAAAAVTGSEWPAGSAERIDLRRERLVDLTGDGRDERVTVTVRGPTYDALDIDLAITSMRGDTLLLERWSSLDYFKYTPIAELADSAVVGIVQQHVDALLGDDSFSAEGLPSALSSDPRREAMREAARYHLAELDWRAAADMRPEDPTPALAYDRIRVENVAAQRVDVVIDEVLAGPMFSYHAGGEANYAVGWSVRENAFVRLYSCC